MRHEHPATARGCPDASVPEQAPRLGDYVIEQEPGYGGMGIVYLACDPANRSTIATWPQCRSIARRAQIEPL